MLKKYLSIAAALLFMFAADHAAAQVYTIHAKYSLHSIYLGGKDPQLSFDRIDTGYNHTLIVDFDKKTITDPTHHDGPIPITEVVHDEGSMFYILKVKPGQSVKWRYYKLMVNQLDQAVYIQETERLKGSGEARDTFFRTHTNDLAALSFYQRSARIKDMTLDEDRSVVYSQTQNFWKQKWRFAENLVEMRDGYINWTTDGEVHHLKIEKVYLIKEEGSNGIRVMCTEKDDEVYDITYARSIKKIEEDQFGPELYIYMIKVVGHKRVWGAVLR